jgi:hypothetical protein
MGKFWRATNGGRYLDALDKWQWLLECCGLDRLDRGGRPAQEAVLLLRLRNSLVHLSPRTSLLTRSTSLKSAFGASSLTIV